MAIKPFGKRLLCRLIPRPDQTATGIVRVETADDAPKMMEVTVCGADVTRVAVGDTILVGRFTGVDVLGDQLISEEEVLCALDGEHAERWRVEVLPFGEPDAAPIAVLYDLPTALRHVGDDGAYLITPGTVDDATRKAILAPEFVTVRASSPGGQRAMTIAKVPTVGLFKVTGQFTARGMKTEEGHYGGMSRRVD
jgi:co-chaperonin GroES (HSP10)